MLPIRQGDGTGLTPKGIAEVRKGDGTVLWSAGADIPDSDVYLHDDWGDNKLQNRDGSGTTTTNGVTGYYRPEWDILGNEPAVSNGVLTIVGDDRIATDLNLDLSEGVRFEWTDVTAGGGTSGTDYAGFTCYAEQVTNDLVNAFPYRSYVVRVGAGVSFLLYECDDTGSITELIDSEFIPSGTHDIAVERSADGTWELFIDGSSYGTASDTTWTAPAYSHFGGRDNADVDVSEVKVSPFTVTDGTFSSGLYTSVSKDSNNPVLSRGSSGAWDEEDVLDPAVILENGTYKMIYRGQASGESTYSFGLATSSDLINWTRDAANPVFSESSSGWDDFRIQVPSLYEEGGTYHMMYHGSTGSSSDAKVGHATSSDLVNWTRDSANPVIDWGSSGDFDDTAINDGTVFEYDGAYYYVYGGYDGSTHRIGYATSDDLSNWTKSGDNPVMVPSDPWEDSTVREPRILIDGTTAHMLYRGGSSGGYEVGYAKTDMSTPGDWQRYESNPILSASDSGWDSQEARNANPIFDGSDYHALYSGYDGSNWGIGKVAQ